ncbi:DUF2508 family protein [Cytobacillus depressus]|uniref:DUF2508 family protein n=1 Tax=Cytobacillus depressus TaxID=1602942 RepID=A0A6L3UW28_9BACI|nr:YaaL family protein [Cytobacillus depressus]KAB2328188.1 DUF2508 family protein [Cytobacillus depressus]
MLFRRKGWLRKEFDEKLINKVNELRDTWSNQKILVEKSFDPTAEVVTQAKLAEAKYFTLFKEVKNRSISLRK